MSILSRALAPAAKATRVTVSEDGTYVVGPTMDSIASYVPGWWGGVTGDTALNYVTIYQCVRVLSHTFAQIPLMLYRRLPNGGKERAIDNQWYRTLHTAPNPGLTSFAWRRLMMLHLATWGNSYNEITYDRLGRPQLYPVRPDRVQVSRESGRRVYDYLDPNGGVKRFPDGTMFHVTALSSDGLIGRSPISDLRSAIRLGKTAETFGDSFFRNNARPGIALKHPKSISAPAQERLIAQMDELRGSGNAGKTVLLEEGMDFQEIGIPPDDAQFMETRLFQKREIAGAYGIPPHKIGDLERATFSNIEHQALELITDTMMPWYVNAETEMSLQLLPNDDELFAEFLVDGYLRGDIESRNRAYATRWQHGSLSSNEWRIRENDNPVEGGDVYWAPVNYAPIERTLAEPPPAPAVEPPPQEGGTPALDIQDLAVIARNGSAKSSEVRCPEGHLVAELATPPYRITCKRCKQVAVG